MLINVAQPLDTVKRGMVEAYWCNSRLTQQAGAHPQMSECLKLLLAYGGQVKKRRWAK